MDDEIKNERDIFAELAKAKANPLQIEVDTEEDEDEKSPTATSSQGEEGQLTIDVYQDEDNIYVQSAVAGVEPDDIDINITREAITIRGSREKSEKIQENNYFYQECFWGSFSRSVVLPEEVDPDKSTASLKNGILTVKMPKFGRKRAKNLKVKTDN
ncbi:MAG: Hsp20/alpha crystallin family protein [Patescibacteria group bacterium]